MDDKLNPMTVVFGAATSLSREICWQPSADVYRTPRGWLIKLELAGVRLDDIAVTVRGSQITITGLRRDWKLEEGSSHYAMEISYNRFERTLELPGDLQGARVKLEGRDGILLVRLTCQGEEP